MKIFTFRVTQPLVGFYEGYVDIEANSEEEGHKMLKAMPSEMLDKLCYGWEQNTDNANAEGNITIEELDSIYDDENEMDEFISLYDPILNENYDIVLYETFGKDFRTIQYVNRVNPKFIWTLIDDNGLWFCPGYHFTNRINYVICQNPWNHDSKNYKY